MKNEKLIYAAGGSLLLWILFKNKRPTLQIPANSTTLTTPLPNVGDRQILAAPK